MQYYLVGGAVRDILMGRIPKDADLAFDGSLEEFFADCPTAQKVGKSVHVYLVDGKEYMPLYAHTITADLLHRDLTINAVALDQQGCIHAHPLAFFDMRHGFLRPASAEAFFQDATRIYRLARFAATFPQFSVHEEALQQAYAVVKTKAHALLPAERVGREFFKALYAEKPSLFLQCLQKIQALQPWFKECCTVPPKDLLHLGALMDGIPPYSSKQDEYMGDIEDVGLIRFLLWGMFFQHSQQIPPAQHPLYQLALRLHLPLHFAKSAVFFASTCEQAKYLIQLPLPTQIYILRQAHILGIARTYWQAIAHVCTAQEKQIQGQNIVSYATQALQCLQHVHLPPIWQNKGELSGKKLLELQCAALQHFHNSHKVHM